MLPPGQVPLFCALGLESEGRRPAATLTLERRPARTHTRAVAQSRSRAVAQFCTHLRHGHAQQLVGPAPSHPPLRAAIAVGAVVVGVWVWGGAIGAGLEEDKRRHAAQVYLGPEPQLARPAAKAPQRLPLVAVAVPAGAGSSSAGDGDGPCGADGDGAEDGAAVMYRT